MSVVTIGRKWIVIGIDLELEIYYVQEVGRNFKTIIGFEEVL